MKISVSAVGLEALAGDIGTLSPKILAAARRAVNRTIDGTSTQARRQIAAQTGIKQTRVKRRLAIRKPKPGELSGRVWVGLLPFPAAYAEPIRPKGMSPKQQRKLPGSTAGGGKFAFPGAFVARMPSGHMGIFKRTGAKRLPLVEEKLTAQQLGIGEIGEGLADYAEQRLERELSHELGRVLGP